MNIKAFVWGCGVIVSLFGLILGVRNAARALDMDNDGLIAVTPLPDSHPDADFFSPDLFREELLK